MAVLCVICLLNYILVNRGGTQTPTENLADAYQALFENNKRELQSEPRYYAIHHSMQLSQRILE